MKFCVFLVVLLAVVAFVTSFPAPQESEDSGVPICKQQMKRGQCRALIPRWTYDVKKGVCLEFKYGGCGGNNNNFKSKNECESTCLGARK